MGCERGLDSEPITRSVLAFHNTERRVDG